MPLRRAFAPMLPEFDSFLFAPVWEEADGAPLSVLSALSRLGLDPRDEAARLAALTKEAAADQLARMIVRLSDRWTLSETRRIAVRLIERLPTSPAGATPGPLAGQTPSFAIVMSLRQAMAGKGHEYQLPPPNLNDRCRLGEATFAGMGDDELNAPIPAVRRQSGNLSGSDAKAVVQLQHLDGSAREKPRQYARTATKKIRGRIEPFETVTR